MSAQYVCRASYFSLAIRVCFVDVYKSACLSEGVYCIRLRIWFVHMIKKDAYRIVGRTH